MKRLCACVLVTLMMAGCSGDPAGNSEGPGANGDGPKTAAPDPAGDAGTPAAPANTVELTPENTRIEFIGTHAGPKPDPRTGNFNAFTGTLVLDPAASSITSIRVEIDTGSLETEIAKLTNHLKSPDFFDVREHPTALFETSSVTPAGDPPGSATVAGSLTLHGVTQSIDFPANVQLTAERVTLESSFIIDRTQFGMDYAPDRVEKEVTLNVKVDASRPAGAPVN